MTDNKPLSDPTHPRYQHHLRWAADPQNKGWDEWECACGGCGYGAGRCRECGLWSSQQERALRGELVWDPERGRWTEAQG